MGIIVIPYPTSHDNRLNQLKMAKKVHAKVSITLETQALQDDLDRLCQRYFSPDIKEAEKHDLGDVIKDKAQDYFHYTGKNYVYHDIVRFTTYIERKQPLQNHNGL